MGLSTNWENVQVEMVLAGAGHGAIGAYVENKCSSLEVGDGSAFGE